MLQACGSQTSASQSLGELVTAQITGPVPEFLVQWAWGKTWEPAFLTLPDYMDAAGLGTLLGTHYQHYCSKQPPYLQWT